MAEFKIGSNPEIDLHLGIEALQYHLDSSTGSGTCNSRRRNVHRFRHSSHREKAVSRCNLLIEHCSKCLELTQCSNRIELFRRHIDHIGIDIGHNVNLGTGDGGTFDAQNSICGSIGGGSHLVHVPAVDRSVANLFLRRPEAIFVEIMGIVAFFSHKDKNEHIAHTRLRNHIQGCLSANFDLFQTAATEFQVHQNLLSALRRGQQLFFNAARQKAHYN